jgi:predicted transcriptional regulator
MMRTTLFIIRSGIDTIGTTHYEVDSIDTSPLVIISADATLRTALEAMFLNGVRQVGIENDETLVGVVTYRSVTRAQLLLSESGLTEGLLRRQVTLAMEDPQPMVDESEDVFTLFDVLAESPYVLVDRGDEYHVLRDVGFHQYLRAKLEVFILVEEIKRAVRNTFRSEGANDLSA